MYRAVIALWKREQIKFVRDRSRLVGALAQPVAVWLLLGFGFQGVFQLPGSSARGTGYLAFLFPGILAMIILFTALFSTISIVEERKAGFLQAALMAPIPRLALVLGTTLGGASLALLEVLLLLPVLLVLDLSLSVSGFLLLCTISMTLGITLTALGVLIAWRVETTRGFHAVMNLVLIPLWVLSGALFPVSGTPEPLRWVMMLNPVTYNMAVLRQAFYGTSVAPDRVVPWGVALAISLFVMLVVLVATARSVRTLRF